MEDRQVGVLLEDIQSKFRVFGESLEGLHEKFDSRDKIIEKLVVDMDLIKVDIKIMRGDINGLKKEVNIIKAALKVLLEDMELVKGELGVIRHELKEKVGRDEFQLLERRILALEKRANI